MSRRAKQQQQQPPPAVAAAAGSSRRTRRAELPRAPAGLAESPQIVSNPIFRCEAAGPSQPNGSPPGDQLRLRCVYRPGSLYALVHDPAASPAPAHDVGIGNGNDKAQQPLPLPPCRAHPSSVRVGPAAHAVGGPHGCRVLMRKATPHDDPFLAAYVACSKSAAGDEVVHRHPQHKQKQAVAGRRRKKKAAAGKKSKEGDEVIINRGCGIWTGWAAGAKYAGAMSCRYGCAVAGQKGDATATTAAKSEDDAPAAAGPTLDLSWMPAVLSARASLEWRTQR